MVSLEYLEDVKRVLFCNNKELADALEYIRYIIQDNNDETNVIEELIEYLEEE